MKLKAFTLTELLIALAVIGILIAILLPVIFNLLPDQNALMAKRSYHGIQNIVSSLINDEACYPDTSQALIADQRIGFDDGYGYADCLKWGGNENEDTIDNEEPNGKFLTLFIEKLDLKDDSVNPKNAAEAFTFTTKDGIVWKAQECKLSHSNSDPTIDLLIDVNGNEKPNCRTNEESGCSNKKDLDRYTVRIHADGTLDILENWALEAVGITHDITGSQDN